MHELTQSFVLIFSKKTLKAIAKDTGNFILLFDNLEAHFNKALRIQSKYLRESHGLVYLILPTYGNQLLVAMLQP